MQDAPPRRAVAPLLAVFLLQLAAFFTPSATWSPMSRFGLAHAVASGEGFALGAWAEATGDRARVGEQWFSDKAPLPALIAAVPFAMTRAIHVALGHPAPAFDAESRGDVPATRVQLSTSAQQLLYASAVGVSGVAFLVLGLTLFDLLRRRYDARTSLVATVVVCVGTPIFPYATSLYGHVPAAAFLTLALHSIDPRGQPRPTLAGLCLAAAVGCEYITAVPAAVIAGFALLSAPAGARVRRVLELVAGALPIVAVLGAYHHVCFGAPWRTGYSHLSNPVFVSGHQRGLMGIGIPSLEAMGGLLVSTRRGLFYLAPIAALAVAGLALPRSAGAPDVDRMPLVGALALGALFLANAGYYMWWGGASAGPRHLVPMLPVLALGVARTWQHPRARPVVLALGALSIVLMVAFTSVGIEAPETGDAIFDFVVPRLRAGEIAALPSATNLGLLLGLPPLLSLVPWLAWFVVVGRILWQRSAP